MKLMIVGAKGGKLQLTLNTVYYLSQPVDPLSVTSDTVRVVDEDGPWEGDDDPDRR